MIPMYFEPVCMLNQVESLQGIYYEPVDCPWYYNNYFILNNITILSKINPIFIHKPIFSQQFRNFAFITI